MAASAVHGILLFVLMLDGVLSLQCPSQKSAEVLIFGAGTAGVTAARILQDNGVTNFKILEANTDRIGGRIRNTTFGGVTIELGANWIHKSPENRTAVSGPMVNPIWTLVHDSNKCFDEGKLFTGHYTDDAEYMDLNSTGQYNVVNADSLYAEFEDILYDKIFYNDANISIRQALSEAGWHPDTPLKKVIEWGDYDYSYGISPNQSSLPLYIAEYSRSRFGEVDYILTDQRGYASVVKCIAEPLLDKIELGSVVTSIDWNDECVCAEVKGKGRMCGDYGIVTFSIGVLQDFLKNNRFNGTLSNKKITAIRDSEMGLYLSIFVSFPYTFWNTETDYIYRADSRKGYYPVIQPIGAILPGSPPMIIMGVTGDEAKRLSSLSEEEIYNEIMDVLHIWYGNDVPNATDMKYYNWYNDKFYRGMFTTIPLNLTVEEKLNLAVPEGRLYLSGEANIIDLYGTVHGAYCSGINAATDILHKKGINEKSTFLPKCEMASVPTPTPTPSSTPTSTTPSSTPTSTTPSSAYTHSVSVIAFIALLFAARYLVLN